MKALKKKIYDVNKKGVKEGRRRVIVYQTDGWEVMGLIQRDVRLHKM